MGIITSHITQRIFGTIFMQQIINSGHNCLFHKWFFTVYFGGKIKMQLHYHIVHKGNMHFGVNQGNDKDKEITI